MSQGEVTEADGQWMQRAIDLSHLCPPVPSAYNVGAIVVSADGQELATGYSRETDAHVHAEESALAKVGRDDDVLRAATMYSSLEPCSQRRSRPRPCSRLILDAGIGRVVIAWREPALFVAECIGVELLREAGTTVIEIADLTAAARAANQSLLAG